MPGQTLDQLGVEYFTYADQTPAAWTLPLCLPGLRAFWANSFGVDKIPLWYDQSGAAVQNNLEEIGAPTIGCATTWPGALVPYIELDGTNDYYTIADNASLSITGDLTIIAWVYHTVNNKWMAIVNKGNTGAGNMSYHLTQSTAGQPRLLISEDGGLVNYNSLYSGVVLGNDAWHFIAARFDPSTVISMRVDNNAWNTSTTSIISGIHDNARPFRIGEYIEGAAYRWDGRIAQVGIYAHYVSDEHIDALYKAQAPLFGTEV